LEFVAHREHSVRPMQGPIRECCLRKWWLVILRIIRSM